MVRNHKERLIRKLREDWEKNVDYIKKKSKEKKVVEVDCLAYRPERDNISRLGKRLDTLFSKRFKDLSIRDKSYLRDTSAYLKHVSTPKSRQLDKKKSRKVIKNESSKSFKSSYKLESSKSPKIKKGLSKKSSSRSTQMKQISPSLAKKVKRDHIFTGSTLQKKLNEIKQEIRGGTGKDDGDSEQEEVKKSPPVMVNLDADERSMVSVDRFMMSHLSLKGGRNAFKPNRNFEPLFDLGKDKKNA